MSRSAPARGLEKIKIKLKKDGPNALAKPRRQAGGLGGTFSPLEVGVPRGCGTVPAFFQEQCTRAILPGHQHGCQGERHHHQQEKFQGCPPDDSGLTFLALGFERRFGVGDFELGEFSPLP